jgi:hypothetical protein
MLPGESTQRGVSYTEGKTATPPAPPQPADGNGLLVFSIVAELRKSSACAKRGAGAARHSGGAGDHRIALRAALARRVGGHKSAQRGAGVAAARVNPRYRVAGRR